MATNVYIGQTGVDIDLKYGDDISDFQWTVVNSAGTAYDFQYLTDLTLDIYNLSGYSRNWILQRPNHASSGVDNVSTNIIEWNDLWTVINLAHGNYYYEVNYQDSNLAHPNVFLFSGNLTVE